MGCTVTSCSPADRSFFAKPSEEPVSSNSVQIGPLLWNKREGAQGMRPSKEEGG